MSTARQATGFHAREGHLQPSRKTVEMVDRVEHKLGLFVDNARRQADKLNPERRQELTELGMRWWRTSEAGPDPGSLFGAWSHPCTRRVRLADTGRHNPGC
ncbi:helicase associated domain-containing protein [Actinacidiphila acididurans]|uniref:Helicase associated domain-containing protein n=1 Tax=Actinacidiphila acididurans TaxID=2784346 RepID=A0ABS2TTK5_9ACTN|nr:helicase associated domain-containing protein [Actinacidiphila acididurans]MBM9506665.1 helicase associated domain-containing protein [Actinacidiphila acididurans]